jgi:hypothetical protein
MLENTFKFRSECLRNMKITTLLLKRAAARGLTLTQMSEIFCRPDEDDTKPSLLENIVQKASLCSSLKLRMKANNKDGLFSTSDETTMAKSLSKGNLKCGSFQRMLKMNLADNASPAPCSRTRGLTDLNESVNLIN